MVSEESVQSQQNSGENAESVVNTVIPAAESTPTEDSKDDKPEETDVQTEPKRSIYTVSAKFYAHEKDFIDKVLESRQKTVNDGKPLTRDMNHFIRQCVRFTLNHNPGMRFFIPEDIQKVSIDT